MTKGHAARPLLASRQAASDEDVERRESADKAGCDLTILETASKPLW
jgi:hypothetical protein